MQLWCAWVAHSYLSVRYGMAALFKIDNRETADLRAGYEEIAYDVLRRLWRRKTLIAVAVQAACLLAFIAVVLMGPSYTSEAILQLNFTQDDHLTRDQQGAASPITSPEAIAVLESAARVIRSRAIASAVVTRLGLDKDPDLPQSRSLKVISAARSAIGMEVTTPSPAELATNALLRGVKVTTQPRTYLILISVASGNPESAATLANAVALEYLRGQALQQLTRVERELIGSSSLYGPRHPTFVRTRTKLEHLQKRLGALGDGVPVEDAVKLVAGHWLIPAEKTMVPSGPNAIFMLGLTAVATVAAAVAAAAWPSSVEQARRRYAPNGHYAQSDTYGLSEREEGILRLLAAGASNASMARWLNDSEATVRDDVRAILRKIHVKNRVQAALWALHHLRNGSGGPRADQDTPYQSPTSAERVGTSS